VFWANSVVLRNRVVTQLWGINNIAGGIFGVPIAFLLTYVVSRYTPAPSQAMQDFVDSIRTPTGGVRLVDKTQAVD
jgi:cation/acetate symporter